MRQELPFRTSLAHERIATRFLKTADISVDQVKEAARSVEEFLNVLVNATEKIKDVINKKAETFDFPYPLFARLYTIYANKMGILTRGVLENYVTNSAQKKAIAFISKKITGRFRAAWRDRIPVTAPDSYREELKKDTKILFDFKESLAEIIAAVKQNKLISTDGGENHSLSVGGFEMINAGGFKNEEVQKAKTVLQSAATFLKNSGFGKVCYGKVLLTKNITSGSNTLAFYDTSNDSLYIRMGLRKASGRSLVQVILHELGHRYDNKFLKDQKGKRELYYSLSGKNQKLKPPAIGDRIPTTKGDAVAVGSDGQFVLCHLEKDPIKRLVRVPFRQWWDSKPDEKMQAHPTMEGFVTEYAGKTPEEMFAEMFSYYALGDLPVNQAVAFEKLVFGVD